MNDDTIKSQIAENFRFYGDMRFKQLTLFMAAMTAAAAGVLQPSQIRWWIALGALYVAAVMWIVEVRSTLTAIAAHDAIPELSTRPDTFWPLLNSSLAVLSLHIAGYVLWLLCVRAWWHSRVPFYIGEAIGVGLLVYSGVNYWRHRYFWLARKRSDRAAIRSKAGSEDVSGSSS